MSTIANISWVAVGCGILGAMMGEGAPFWAYLFVGGTVGISYSFCNALAADV